jgi:peptidoglycan/xylan/chitin deacetylase (PgdA/CDA1 family)
VTGFVNVGRHALGARGLCEVLDRRLAAGAELGNHSHSYPDLNEVPLDLHTADIIKGAPAIRSAPTAGRRDTIEVPVAARTDAEPDEHRDAWRHRITRTTPRGEETIEDWEDVVPASLCASARDGIA